MAELAAINHPAHSLARDVEPSCDRLNVLQLLVRRRFYRGAEDLVLRGHGLRLPLLPAFFSRSVFDLSVVAAALVKAWRAARRPSNAANCVSADDELRMDDACCGASRAVEVLAMPNA